MFIEDRLLFSDTIGYFSPDISYPENDTPIKQTLTTSNKILVKSTILDNNSQALFGATILDKSNNYNYTTTDFVGNFEIEVLPTSKLEIRYQGFVSQEIQASNFPNLLKLVEETNPLDTVWLLPVKNNEESTNTNIWTWVILLIALLTYFKKK